MIGTGRTVITQEQGYTGLTIKIPRVLTPADYATVISKGWWNNNQITSGQPALNSQDLVAISLDYGCGCQTTEIFSVSIDGKGIVTLSPTAVRTVFPVVPGDFVLFVNDQGTIVDSGLAPSSSSGSAKYVSVSDGSFTAGNLMKLNDANGTIADQGNSMKVGKQVSVSGGAAAQTVTDAFCKTTSSVIASWNDTANAVEIKTVAAGNGSFIVTSTGDPGASHINYVIFN